MNNRFMVRLAFLAMLAVLLPATASGQDRSYVGLGYVASAPELFAGAQLYGVSADLFGGLGLYVDAKFDIDRPTEEPGYESGLTAEQVENEIGDEFFRSDDVWYNVNAALMRPVTESLVLYVGAGYASRKTYNQYEDPDGPGEYGVGGFYWVEDQRLEVTRVNLLGGAMMSISSRINVHFGAELQPKGIHVGASYLFPL